MRNRIKGQMKSTLLLAAALTLAGSMYQGRALAENTAPDEQVTAADDGLIVDAEAAENGFMIDAMADAMAAADSGNNAGTEASAEDETDVEAETEADSGTDTEAAADSGVKTDTETSAVDESDIDTGADAGSAAVGSWSEETEREARHETRQETRLSSQADDLVPAKLIRGKALQKGDCIGITAPAYFIKNDDFNQTVMLLRKLGYRVKVTRSCTSRDRYFAGTDRQRAMDLNRLFEDESVDAIMCLRGGYGCARILDYLDYDMIARHPKLLIGYSDITALHIALLQKCGLITVHGPMVSSFASIYSDYMSRLFLTEMDLEKLTDDEYVLPDSQSFDLRISSFRDTPMGYTLAQFLTGISLDEPIGEIELPAGEKLETIVPGKARGRIVGGNLTVIDTLVGTDYELLGDHALLFFEEVGEDAYRVDRVLQQLYQNGLLDRIDGILIGEMTNMRDQAACSCEDVLREYAQLAGKPCISGVPAGHGDNNMFLPLGVMAEMTANEDGSASLVILEKALD